MTHLFHYTDAHALQSILLNRRLWLTDLRFMNDSTELLHGIEYLSRALAEPPQRMWYADEYVESAIEQLSGSLSRYRNGTWLDDPVFGMSFSKKDDLLSQWRGYGSYAIAFHQEVLEEAGVKLRPCIYQDEAKRNQAMLRVTRAGISVSQSMARNAGCLDSASIEEQAALIELAATFKDAGFEEECEVRMIAQPEQHEIRYRPRNGILIPYVEVEIQPEAIAYIRIGPNPNQSLAAASMAMFLNSVQNDYYSNGGNIEWNVPVKMSKTPFRA